MPENTCNEFGKPTTVYLCHVFDKVCNYFFQSLDKGNFSESLILEKSEFLATFQTMNRILVAMKS